MKKVREILGSVLQPIYDWWVTRKIKTQFVIIGFIFFVIGFLSGHYFG